MRRKAQYLKSALNRAEMCNSQRQWFRKNEAKVRPCLCNQISDAAHLKYAYEELFLPDLCHDRGMKVSNCQNERALARRGMSKVKRGSDSGAGMRGGTGGSLFCLWYLHS